MIRIWLTGDDFDDMPARNQEQWWESFRKHEKTPPAELRNYEVQIFALIAERWLETPEEPQTFDELQMYRAWQLRYLELSEELVKRLLVRHRKWAASTREEFFAPIPNTEQVTKDSEG